MVPNSISNLILILELEAGPLEAICQNLDFKEEKARIQRQSNLPITS